MEYVITGKFPITEDSATYLASLMLQTRYGDQDPSQDIITE